MPHKYSPQTSSWIMHKLTLQCNHQRQKKYACRRHGFTYTLNSCETKTCGETTWRRIVDRVPLNAIEMSTVSSKLCACYMQLVAVELRENNWGKLSCHFQNMSCSFILLLASLATFSLAKPIDVTRWPLDHAQGLPKWSLEIPIHLICNRSPKLQYSNK